MGALHDQVRTRSNNVRYLMHMPRTHTHPRDHLDACANGLFGVSTKFDPAVDVSVIRRYDVYGVEIKISSMKRDGTESCVVITRGIETSRS